MATVEIAAIEAGTRISITEQIVILDGGDSTQDRLRGWGEVIDILELEI